MEGEIDQHSDCMVPIGDGPSIMCDATGAPLVQRNPDYIEGYTVPKSLGFDLGEVEVTQDGRILQRLDASDSVHRLLRILKATFDPFDWDDESAEAKAWHAKGDFPWKAASEEEGNKIWDAMKGADEEGARFGGQESIEELVVLKGGAGNWEEIARVPLA